MHLFPKDIEISAPERFNNPFRYFPHPLVKAAAGLLMDRIAGSKELDDAFSEGKMLGVLIVSDSDDNIGYLAGFSGNAGGRSNIEGFVPPIYDLLDPEGYFKKKEAEISSINAKLDKTVSSGELQELKARLSACERMRDEEIKAMKERMTVSKKEREALRILNPEPNMLERLIRESQHEKAELRRLKTGWERKIRHAEGMYGKAAEEIKDMKVQRASLSEELQKWIFSRYIVHNTSGQSKSIGEVFAALGLTPPGGTGECAAPKLLEHAFRNGLRPLAMGEFWYGKSPDTAVRTHGHFYPSCTSKCGPLLNFMLEGLPVSDPEASLTDGIRTIHEDNSIIVIDKPSGIPSVPGLNGVKSALEFLEEKYGKTHPVHRLDMDTSGILIFAKTQEAAVHLQRQFEEHTIIKTYIARLSPSHEGANLDRGDKGDIRLPLSPDYDERPRQKVDRVQGRQALTEYEVISTNEDGTTDIRFHPHTGRTHQLRVHSAHALGLGRPIVGDMLYGGAPAERLHLHAAAITFRHPKTESPTTFTSDINKYI